MRKTILALMLALVLTPTMASAVSAPTGLSAGPISANTANLYWTEDATVSQWYIYFAGVLRYQPLQSETGVSGTVRSYLMQNLPNQASIVVTMKALSPGAPLSSMSAAITLTASTVPITYVLAPPGQAVTVAGTFSTSTYSAATGNNVSMTADTSAASAARNASLAALASAVCTTCTPKALFTGKVRLISSIYTGIAGSVSYPSGVIGDSLVFLTLGARTRTTITQSASNTQTARFVATTSLTPPANTDTVFQELVPGAVVVLEDSGASYLHIWNTTAPNQFPIVVKHEFDKPWIGTTY
jgi:hypothetical protein